MSQPLVKFALGARWNWGVVLAAFIAISWLADTWASHAKLKPVQYLGLAVYVCAEALIFVPLLTLVAVKSQMILARGGAEPHIIRDAGVVTVGVFVMLTLSVFISKRDFSFLRSGLLMAGGAALTLIDLSLGFGFNLGLGSRSAWCCSPPPTCFIKRRKCWRTTRRGLTSPPRSRCSRRSR